MGTFQTIIKDIQREAMGENERIPSLIAEVFNILAVRLEGCVVAL